MALMWGHFREGFTHHKTQGGVCVRRGYKRQWQIITSIISGDVIICPCPWYLGPYSQCGESFTTRSRDISKPRYSGLNLSNRSEIWQTHRQHGCRDDFQFQIDTIIIATNDNFETSRDLTVRRPSAWWIEAIVLAEVHIWCNPYFQTGQYGTIGIISAQWRHSHVALGGRWQLLVPLGWRHVRQHPRCGHRELGCARFWRLWSRPVQLVRVEQHDYGMSDWKLERHGCVSTNCMLWVHGRYKIKYSSHCKRRYVSRKHNATGCCEKETVISVAPC